MDENPNSPGLFPSTKVVLFEGLPGAGKSTAAHHAMLAARASGLDVIWNYEEEREHPVALFRDEDELASVVDAVFNGRHQDVITRAVQLWSQFGSVARQGEAVRFLDGFLFGSLGWTLHVADVPEDEISDYFHRVQGVLKCCNPVIVWLSEPDVGATFERLRARGGDKYAEQHVERSLAYPYAKRRNFHGEEGAQRVWSDYQSFVERFLSEGELQVIYLSSAGGFEARESELLQRMGLPALIVTSISPAEAEEFVGCYTACDEPTVNVTVRYGNDHLWADGLPGVWPSTKLLHLGANRFALESFPVNVHFWRNDTQFQMHIDTLSLLGSSPEGKYIRTVDNGSGS